MSIIYKIRRADGMFSMGGSTPSFNKTGKIWKQKGHLTSHLSQLWNGNGMYNQHQPHVYSDCEIVTYELTEMPIGPTQSIEQYLHNIERKKQEQEAARIARCEQRDQDERYAAYLTLKNEFE